MNFMQAVFKQLFHDINSSKAIAVVLGNLFLGLGVAGMKLSGLGNDPSTAMNIAMSDVLGMGLGNYQLLLNLFIFCFQAAFGRKFIGIGTIINMVCIGYIVQYSLPVIDSIFGNAYDSSLFYQLFYMFIALLVLSFGISMYQLSNQGVAPYDYISLGIADRFKTPYFITRICVDCTGIIVITILFILNLIPSPWIYLGISTVAAAFCFGPFISLFNKVNGKWIRQ